MDANMSTLDDVAAAARRYREGSHFLDPYRFPRVPGEILRFQVPPCSVCDPRVSRCDCGQKAKREALQYSTSVGPDPIEAPPNEDYIKTLPRNLEELYQSVPSCNPSDAVEQRFLDRRPMDEAPLRQRHMDQGRMDHGPLGQRSRAQGSMGRRLMEDRLLWQGLPLNFGYIPTLDKCPRRREQVCLRPCLFDEPGSGERFWREVEPSGDDVIHVTGLQRQSQRPLCRCDLPLYHTFESSVKSVEQHGHPVNFRSEALSRVGAGQKLPPRPPRSECRSDDSMRKHPMNRELTPCEATRGLPGRLVGYPPADARLNRWRPAMGVGYI